MYDEEIKETVLSDLESRTMNVVNTAIVLASQGYLINKNKYTKLYWSSILFHAFENIDILNKKQINNIENIYNKVITL